MPDDLSLDHPAILPAASPPREASPPAAAWRGALASSAFRLFVRCQAAPGGARAGARGFWGALLDSDVPVPWMLFDRFVASRDFRDGVAPLIRLYFCCLARPPDPDGLRHWTRRLGQGLAVHEVAQQVCDSPEFTALHGRLGDDAFVELAYRRTLRRSPDEDARRFWRERLASGALTRGRMMWGFCNAPEYREATDDRLYVTMMYLGLLHRAADPGGLDYWAGQRRARRPRLLERFIDAARAAG